MSRMTEDESERTNLHQRRFTPREDQEHRNLERVKEAKKLLQGGPADRN